MIGSDISWLHPPGLAQGATWSPWHGCTPVHAGCAHCWSGALNRRWGHDNWGRGKPRRVTAASGWKLPLSWARRSARKGQRMLAAPLGCDVLDGEVYSILAPDNDEIASWATFDRFMQLIAATGHIVIDEPDDREDPREVGYPSGPTPARPSYGITWLLLTKRPENWRWIPEHVRPYCWLIASVSDQPTLDAAAPHLLAAEGFAGLGLSAEPLVGPMDLGRTRTSADTEAEPLKGIYHVTHAPVMGEHNGGIQSVGDGPRISWVIIGGESGPRARPCNIAWIRNIVRQCREAGVPTNVKQLGSHPRFDHFRALGNAARAARAAAGIRHPSGADRSEWPEHVRVQEWPDFGGGR